MRCEYCGFVNRVRDSENYAEELRREVAKWLGSLVPQQVAIATADLVARKNIFDAYLRPKLLPIAAGARAKFLDLALKPLVAFLGATGGRCEGPRQLFEESLKVEAAGELAVEDDDRKLVGEALRFLKLSAFLCNALEAASAEKFAEAARNVKEARGLLDPAQQPDLAMRLDAAIKSYAALSAIAERDVATATTEARDAVKILEELSRKAKEGFIAPVDSELAWAKVIEALAEAVAAFFEAGRDPLEAYVTMKEQAKASLELLRHFSHSPEEYVHVAGLAGNALAARAGKATVKVIGSGDLLVPFYVVSFGFTYVAGGLLRKKGEEAHGYLLVAAPHPHVRGISDTFNLYHGKQLDPSRLGDAAKALEGMLSEAVETRPGARLVLPTLTPGLAELVADTYLSSAKSKYHGRLSSITYTRAKELVYVGARVQGTTLSFPEPIVAKVYSWDGLKSLTV
ncbi:MAG: hypothetical protein ABWK00_06130 [Desulfurococcaceae archaeon]